MRGVIGKLRGRRRRQRVSREDVPRRSAVRSLYDAAQTTPDNRRHWANADAHDPVLAADQSTRQVLRNRARYEVANNCYARGLVNTLANDTTGWGPRLQLPDNAGRWGGLAAEMEAEFAAWASEVDLAGKLRTMRMARAQDGEAFALMVNNPAVDHPVQLDLRLIEADQVEAPDAACDHDGIVYDDHGNPVEYQVLRDHPGGCVFPGRDNLDRVPADQVIHWYRVDRPGQRRGLPELMPALPLFAQLRRYTLAVIKAAETAANIAAVMRTNMPAGGEAAAVEPMAELEFEPNMALFAPEGWEPFQIKAEQPATSYAEFKREILNEIARCMDVPFNVAAGNSSGYNYASGRLDHQTYFKSIDVTRRDIERRVLRPILRAWAWEASLSLFGSPEARGAIMAGSWMWPGREHVDPAKEANAQATRLASHTTTLAREYARQGLDWQRELEQRAAELRFAAELGLEAAGSAENSGDEGDGDDDDDDDKDTE